MEDNIAVAYQVSADNGNELEYCFFGLFDGCVTADFATGSCFRLPSLLATTCLEVCHSNSLRSCYFRHGGDTASRFAKDHLMNFIVSNSEFWSDKDEDVLTSIRKGFIDCHLAMWKDLGELTIS